MLMVDQDAPGIGRQLRREMIDLTRDDWRRAKREEEPIERRYMAIHGIILSESVNMFMICSYRHRVEAVAVEPDSPILLYKGIG